MARCDPCDGGNVSWRAVPTADRISANATRQLASDVERRLGGLGGLFGGLEEQQHGGREATACSGSRWPPPDPGSASRARRPVRRLRGAVERHERELGDQQPGVELGSARARVVELERERALPAGSMNPAVAWTISPSVRATTSLDPRHDVVGQLRTHIRGPAEAELPGWMTKPSARWRRPPRSARQAGRRAGRSPATCGCGRRGRCRRRRRSTDAGCTSDGFPRFDDDPAVIDEATDRAVREHRDGHRGAEGY